MFMRTVRFDIAPADVDAFLQAGQPVIAQARKALSGMVSQSVGIDADGKVLSVAVWESAEAAEAASAEVRALWAQLGRFMRAPPEFAIYPHCEQVR